ncbi:MAG: hypothetical protein AAF581_11070 [Planctomycetota bacterium]
MSEPRPWTESEWRKKVNYARGRVTPSIDIIGHELRRDGFIVPDPDPVDELLEKCSLAVGWLQSCDRPISAAMLEAAAAKAREHRKATQ